MLKLFHQLHNSLKNLPNISKCCIAYSGGLDSTVLLHSLVQIMKQDSDFSLRAVHIDHGLSIYSPQWSKHCQQFCNELMIDCTILQIDVKKNIAGNSLEEVARTMRYE